MTYQVTNKNRSGDIMKIKNITYPTTLEKIPDLTNDNIDVFVETEDGMHFTMTVCTPQFYYYYMEKENLDYIPASPPDVIVKVLEHGVIKKALETFCEQDGYWMKLYYLSGSQRGAFAEGSLNAMIREESNE